MKNEVRKMFLKLEESGIHYFLLSNFDNDFKTYNRGDIDIYVSKRHRVFFLKTLKSLGWLERREVANNRIHNFFYKTDGTFLFCLDVKFDLMFGINEGCMWGVADRDRFVKDVVKNSSGVFRPRGLGILLFYVAHVFKEKNKIQKKHIERLTRYVGMIKEELISEEREEYGAMINMINNNEIDQFIVKYFFKINKIDIPRRRKIKIGRGYKILFLGTDGTGKTTTIKNLSSKLNIKTFFLYLGENHWVSSFIGRVFSKKKKNGFMNIICIYFLYPFDLLLRVVKSYKYGRGRLVLIDRIPGFPFLNKGLMSSIYRFIIPRVDLVVLLEGNAQDIWERKKECSLEKTKNDIKKWRKVAYLISDSVYVVDSVCNSEKQVVDNIVELIIAKDVFLKYFFKEIRIV